jgi:O-antigen/teichoic acid export membrane protein
MVATFLVGVQLARGLGVTGYGYYGIAMAVITLATIPGALGIPKLVTREVAAAQARNDPGALFGVIQWADKICGRLSGAIAAAMAIGAFVTWRAASPVLGLTLLLGAPLVALLPLTAIRAGALRGLHHIVLGQISAALIRPIILSIILLGLFATGITLGAPLVMALNSVIALLILLLTNHWLTRRLGARRAPLSIDGRGWLASSIPMGLADAVFHLQLQLAVLLLGVFASPAEVGLLRVSMAVAAVITVPVTVVNITVLPLFARLHSQGEHSRLQKVLTSTARVQCAGVILLSFPLLAAAGWLLGLVFGSSYVPAADTLRILIVGAIVSAAFGTNGALLNMTGHERRVTRGVSIALVVNVVLVVALAPKWGSVGSAVAILAGQCCWNVLLWVDARRRLQLETSIIRKR